MLRLLAVLAALVVGCGASASANLLTYKPDSCHPAPNAGQLVADPQFGTVLMETPAGPRIPVAWPSGHTGRYVGGEVEVIDDGGNIVAVTGRQYELIGVFGNVAGTNALEACGVFAR